MPVVRCDAAVSFAPTMLAMALTVAAGLIVWQRTRLRKLRTHIDATALELERLQRSCALLAPTGVVERLFADGPEAIAEHKVFTAMFTDLVGYTALSERLDPAALAGVVDGYFELVRHQLGVKLGSCANFLC